MPAVTAAAPLRNAPIQPGAPVCGVDGLGAALAERPACSAEGTLSFVFKDTDGALYIGTAAHGFSAATTQVYVRTCGGCPLEHEPFGDIAFSSDSLDPEHLEAGDADTAFLDFALIKIRRPWYKHVEPRVRYWGGPTGLVRYPEAIIGDTAVAYGNGSDRTVNTCQATATGAGSAAAPGPRGPGEIISTSPTAFSSTVCEVAGDSGMPYLHGASGKAVAVNGNCLCGAGIYPTVEYVLDRIQKAAHLDLDLVTGEPAAPLASLLSR